MAEEQATGRKSSPWSRQLAGTLARAGRRWRHTARWLGLAIFAVGAGLLGYAFWEALKGFQHSTPHDVSDMLAGLSGKQGIDVRATVVTFGSEILRVLYLLLLGYLASAIASKGIAFFAASEAVIDEAVIDQNLLGDLEES